MKKNKTNLSLAVASRMLAIIGILGGLLYLLPFIIGLVAGYSYAPQEIAILIVSLLTVPLLVSTGYNINKDKKRAIWTGIVLSSIGIFFGLWLLMLASLYVGKFVAFMLIAPIVPLIILVLLIVGLVRK